MNNKKLVVLILFIISLSFLANLFYVLFYDSYETIGIHFGNRSQISISSTTEQKHAPQIFSNQTAKSDSNIDAGMEALDNLANACNKEGKSNPLFSFQLAPNCRDMFNNGSLVRPDHWEAPTCKSLDYTWRYLKLCLRQKKSVHNIAILGDSRLRQLANKFDNFMKQTTTPTLARTFHADITYEEQLLNLKINFFWQTIIDDQLKRRFSNWLSFNCSDIPDMVIVGVGTWYLEKEAVEKNIAPYVLSEFEAGLRDFFPVMKMLNQRIPVIWVGQGTAFMKRRPNASFRNITDYNAVTEKILNNSGITFWKSAHTMAQEMFHQSRDMCHYSDNVTQALVNILWNFYCNSKINITSDHCCVTPRVTNRVPMQITTHIKYRSCSAFTFGCLVFLLIIFRCFRKSRP